MITKEEFDSAQWLCHMRKEDAVLYRKKGRLLIATPGEVPEEEVLVRIYADPLSKAAHEMEECRIKMNEAAKAYRDAEARVNAIKQREVSV